MNHLKVINNQLCFCILLRNCLVTFFFFFAFLGISCSWIFIQRKTKTRRQERSIYIPFKKNMKIIYFCGTSFSVFIFHQLIVAVFTQAATKIFFPWYVNLLSWFSRLGESNLLLNQKYPYIYACFFTYLELVTQFQFQEISFLRNILISREIIQIDWYLTTMIPVLCFKNVSRDLTYVLYKKKRLQKKRDYVVFLGLFFLKWIIDEWWRDHW